MKKLLLSLLMFVSCNMIFSQNEFEYVAGCAYSDIIGYYDRVTVCELGIKFRNLIKELVLKDLVILLRILNLKLNKMLY